ncbi:meiotic cell cortex C-terminal pleckstrin homology-domain-containing protein [Helicostylum pulchrum]|nr:meiotic cell cortex C-terminal pleckstrin homology-domain-containing protein [Helicostylum pulchrum]
MYFIFFALLLFSFFLMTKIKDLPPPLNEINFQAQENREPSFTNSLSPRQSTYMDSDCSPGSTYSSDYILNPATKIPINFGHGLLSQVQKMQSLLEEYQNSLTVLEIEKADHQQEINKLESRLKAKGLTEEKYKEDIWNLELKNQELYQRINDLTHQLSRSQLDRTRFLRQESQLIQDLDQLKSQHQIWQQTTQESHHLELTCLKKSLHTTRLEKESLFNQLQQKVIEPNKLTDHAPVNSDTALSLPTTLPNAIHPTHITVLQTSLTEAHHLIETMQQKLDLEKHERKEIDKLLREAQETIENYGSITSPTLSVHNSSCHHISSSNHHHRHQGCKKSSAAAAASAALGKSLGDELSLATSLPNLTAPVNIVDHHQRQQQKNKKTNELSLVQLPSQSNFLSPTTSIQSVEDEDNNYNGDIEQYAQYGSLLKKPTSYFYKSTRKESPPPTTKQITPSILFASSTTDSILNTNNHLELFPSNRIEPHTTAMDDGSVTALTRTMIGDWMYKYTRKVVGSGISENRHRRFFWIHPYTQTLYWSSREPGSSAGTSNTKSALVESFVLLPFDHKREKSCPPCILIQTPLRGLKVECIDMPSHDAWIKSLQFILADNTQPRLSQLGSVSKRHYLNRKKSRQGGALFPIADGEPDSTMFNNSTLVDVTSSSNNFLLNL